MNVKNILFGLFSLAFLLSHSLTVLAAGISIETKITSIQVQDNRTWINISPGISSSTACSYKDGVEISNEGSGANPNRDLIMTVAISAQVSGKSVQWVTSDSCSNVGRDLIRGIILVN